MLYCKTCKFVADVGCNTCNNCKNGFVSVLVCGSCGREVPRGAAACAQCPTQADVVGLVPGMPAPRGGGGGGGNIDVTIMPYQDVHHSRAMAIPGLPLGLPAPIRESYEQRRFGVDAAVQMNGKDAAILTKMQAAGALLHVLAQEMNNLQGFMPSTREVIKGLRKMALELQEEVEVRIGPQG